MLCSWPIIRSPFVAAHSMIILIIFFFCNQINASDIWYWKISRWWREKSKNKILKYFNAAQILYPKRSQNNEVWNFSSISSINTRLMCSCSCSAKIGAYIHEDNLCFKCGRKESRSYYLMFQIAIRESHVSSPLCCCQLVCALWEW